MWATFIFWLARHVLSAKEYERRCRRYSLGWGLRLFNVDWCQPATIKVGRRAVGKVTACDVLDPGATDWQGSNYVVVAAGTKLTRAHIRRLRAVGWETVDVQDDDAAKVGKVLLAVCLALSLATFIGWRWGVWVSLACAGGAWLVAPHAPKLLAYRRK